MNRIYAFIGFALCALVLTATAFAEEPQSITFQLPENFISDTCKTPAWNNVSVKWEGVVDKRPNPEVGIQIQSGKEPVPVISSPAIDQVFNKALSDLLPACGMKFVDKDENITRLSVEIREFFTGVQKKLITGKSESLAAITFVARNGGQYSSATVGYEIESKKIRTGNIKQLQKNLNELFAATLRQVPATQEVREIK